MKKSYIYRRKNNLIDMLIGNHFWLRVAVEDGATGGGDYVVRVFRTRFVVEDPNPGADSSVLIAEALRDEINEGSERVEAFEGAETNEVLIRFNMLGQHPSDANYDASTTDEEGDISIRRVYPQSYSVQNASNWDQTFDEMQEVSRTKGFVSDGVRKYQDAHRLDASQLKHRTRFLFDPSDYDENDGDVSFFRIHTNISNTEVREGPIEIVMTSDQFSDVGDDALILTGTVPAAASFSDGYHLRLPVRASKFEIRNKGDNDLFVAFDSGASEFQLEPGQSFSDNRSNIVGFTLRGDGGETDVEIFATIKTSQFIS